MAILVILAVTFVVKNEKAAKKITDWIQQETAKPAPHLAAPAPSQPDLSPLDQLISSCQKLRAGYEACMIKGGYASNTAWQDAHKLQGTGTGGYQQSLDYLQDKFRSGPSPTYHVPFWVPRVEKPKH